MALVTQADFAKSHGVSRKTATIWKAKGYLVLKGDKVDADASDHRLKDLSLGRFTTKGQGNSQGNRSEEHTSELQSLMRISYAVFCLKNNNQKTITNNNSFK